MYHIAQPSCQELSRIPLPAAEVVGVFSLVVSFVVSFSPPSGPTGKNAKVSGYDLVMVTDNL